MTAIVDIIGREILDSRGNPTVEVDVVLEDGARAERPSPQGPRPVRTKRSRYVTTTEPLSRQGRPKGRRCGQRRDFRGIAAWMPRLRSARQDHDRA